MDNNNPVSQQPQSWQNQQVVVNNTLENRGNGLGTAGFVLALLGVLRLNCKKVGCYTI